MYSSVPSPSAQWNLDTGPAPVLERTPPTPVSPSSPTRSGRLRGLSYLRNYTQNHILSRDSHNSVSTSQQGSTISRTTSYPSPTSPAAAQENHRQPSPPTQRSASDIPPARTSNPDSVGSTSGWLPTVGGQSGVSRIASEPQSTDTPSSAAVLSANTSSGVTSELTASMTRARSATAAAALDQGGLETPQSERLGQRTTVNGSSTTPGMAHSHLPSIRFTAHQDPRAQRPSLVFSPMARILPTGKETIKVGRYSERDTQPQIAPNVPSAAPVGFKSKVVSRRHCEFWFSAGRWFIKDVKSSSGTFLNHIRLSSPGTESRPFPVNDGDIVQLGIDFKGGEEMIFRCVKIRVELNKGWQNGPSSFNLQSHKRLRELNLQGKAQSGSSQDCSICLGPIAPCQSLFVAPCSHTWHYKCIRVIINGPHWPHFICPNCRAVADLEAELEDPYAAGDWEEVEAVEAESEVPAQVAEATQTVESPSVLRTTRQQTTEETAVMVEPSREGSEHEHSGRSDIDMAETSDDSGDQGVHQAGEDLGYLNISEPSSTSSDPRPLISNTTVAPVDITPRNTVVNSSAASAAHLSQPHSHTERTATRTPSPNGLGAELQEILTGPEAPMTPRNDAGPFIFDGGAGRAADIQPATIVSMNLDAAANTPSPQPTPPPTT